LKFPGEDQVEKALDKHESLSGVSSLQETTMELNLKETRAVMGITALAERGREGFLGGPTGATIKDYCERGVTKCYKSSGCGYS